ncbi:TIGR00725 family protein [Chloroflexota bacterium]
MLKGLQKMSEEKKKIIAVIGGSQPSPEEARLAEEVGRELARQGATLVCGGLGGIMETACRGASSEGGVTIGILPGDNSKAANPYVQIPVVTGMGYARNISVVKSAQAVIAIGGSYGTLSEIAHALQSEIPVIGLNTWSLSRNGRQDNSIILAQDAAGAVSKALTLTKNL